MKKLLFTLLLVSYVFNSAQAQCGDSEICNSNTGLYSNDDAASIAYDNMGSAFHSTYIKEPNSGWRVWGEEMANNGQNHSLNPTSFTVANYPALTGTIYKMAIASNYTPSVQLLVLTSTGLFVLGSEGAVIHSDITTSSTFQKITVDGKLDGLPVGVGPADVRMLFASTRTVIITTCIGEVYVLSQNVNVRGNGGIGSALQWSKVMQNATQPLNNVIVARGNTTVGYALKSDGTLWTWGDFTLLGDGAVAANRTYATQMTLPAGLPGIKTIQATTPGLSYYILGTDKKVYSLGSNTYGQLGDRTTTYRTVWVNAKNPDNSIITDAAWISANEHDLNYSAVAIIKTGGVLYTAGNNASYMVGQDFNSGVNHLDIPNGVLATDVITYAEVGGHTCALIKLGSIRYGYVGHRVNGSMGDGTGVSSVQQSYDFITPPIVAVCGTLCLPPTIVANSPICPGQNGVFTISGTPGDIVTYTLNNGTNQNVVIGAGGSVAVTVTGALTNQTINLNFILGATGSCSNNLAITATIVVGNTGNVVPAFNQVDPICVGGTLSPLPTTSTNGVVGTWSPALNSAATTTYTFTPTSSTCAVTTTMTVGVISSGTVPTFNQVASICQGGTFTLPAVSLEGIPGTWSPAINNTATTIYTFTPSVTGACFNNMTAQMTVAVTNGTTPTFNPVAAICNGAVLNPLPTTSLEGITGTWSPALNNTLTTTYTFTPSVSCANTTQMTITVIQIVTPTFTQVNPICQGTPLAALPLISNNSVNGTWSPAPNNNTTTTYTFTPATGSCANTIQMTIGVIPRLTPTFPSFAPVCYGDTTFTLPSVSNNNVSGTWSPAISSTATTTYTFTPNAGECANSTSVQVVVLYDFDFVYDGYCKNGEYMLEVSPSNATFAIDSATFIWQHNATTVSTNSIFNVTAYLNSTTIVETLPITFTITVVNADGCPKTKTIVLDNVFCGIQKGISLNGDNLNDFFDLRLLEVSHLSIFNRYGVEVYSKDNYYDEWHGQTDKGDLLPDGTYYYLIDFDNIPSKTGWIYVIREQ